MYLSALIVGESRAFGGPGGGGGADPTMSCTIEMHNILYLFVDRLLNVIYSGR